MSLNKHKSGAAFAWIRASWVAPVLATILITAVIVAVWQSRIVAEATVFRILRTPDPTQYFFPMLDTGFSELREGRLFLWNPYQMCGIPGIATGIVGLLYPPNLFYLLLPTAEGMEFLTVVHLLFAAIATMIAARSFHISWLGATFAGIAYSLTYPLSMIYFPNGVAALSWFPLGIAAIERTVSGGDRRWLPVLSVAAAMPWLAAAPQIATYIWCAFAISAYCALLRAGHRSRSLTDTSAIAVWLLVAMTAAALLAAPQSLPTLELAQVSARASDSLPITAYTPWGRPSLLAALELAFIPPEELVPTFLGAVMVAVGCAAFWTRRLGLKILCVLLISWGSVAVLAPDWYLHTMHSLPLVRSYRLPSRVFFCATLAMALLAGLGVDTILGYGTSKRRQTGAITTVAIVGLGLAYFRQPHASWWVPAALLAVLGLAFVPANKVRDLYIFVGLSLLLVLDVVGFTKNTSILPYADGAWRHTTARMEVLSAVRERAGLDRTVLWGTSSYRPEWFPKLPTLARLFAIDDHEPLVLSHYADFLQVGAVGHPNRSTGANTETGDLPKDFLLNLAPESQRFRNMLSVRYVVADDLAWFDPPFLEFAGSLKISTFDAARTAGVKVIENRHALQRAYAVYQAECIEKFDDQLDRLRHAGFDPTRSVVLDSGCEEPAGAPGAAPTVSVTNYLPSRVEITASVDQPAWLVLTDTYYPGWQAFVNGKRTTIRRANGVVRAVRLPAGDSRVEFRYVPWSFYSGVIGAGSTIVLWIGWMLLRRRSRRVGIDTRVSA